MLVVGLLMYFALANSKLQEVGRIAIFCGLLGLCLTYATSSVTVGDSVHRR